MYSVIKSMHSFWAYAAIGLVLIATINAIWGMMAKKDFTPRDRKISLFALISAHIQLLLGIVLYFVSDKVSNYLAEGMSEVMSNSTNRLYVLEHPLMNILAIVLITIGWSRHKNALDDSAKFKRIGWMYLVGLIFLLSRIPYSVWLG